MSGPGYTVTAICGTCNGESTVPCPDSRCLGGDTYDGITGAKRCCRRCHGKGAIPCWNPECRGGQVVVDEDEQDASAQGVRGA